MANLSRNPKTVVSRSLMKSRDPRIRNAGRVLARGRVTPGSQLDLAIQITAKIMKDTANIVKDTGGASPGGGPAVGDPMVSTDVYTPTPSSGRRRKVSRLSKVDYDLAQQ